MMRAPLIAASSLFICCTAAHAAGPAEPSTLTSTLLGMIAVLALMAGAFWLMKRVGMVRQGAASVAKVVGLVSVGNRERVIVVETGDQWVIVGVAPGRVSPLAQLPRQARTDTPSDSAPASPNFAYWLKRTIDMHNGNTSR